MAFLLEKISKKRIFEKKIKKNEKNLKKLLTMVIYMWYIFIALDKKALKNPLKNKGKMIFENWAKRQDYLSS